MTRLSWCSITVTTFSLNDNKNGYTHVDTATAVGHRIPWRQVPHCTTSLISTELIHPKNVTDEECMNGSRHSRKEWWIYLSIRAILKNHNPCPIVPPLSWLIPAYPFTVIQYKHWETGVVYSRGLGFPQSTYDHTFIPLCSLQGSYRFRSQG